MATDLLKMGSQSLLLEFDRAHLKNYTGLIGLDEAGRGSLAGPVSGAAVAIARSFFNSTEFQNESKSFNDSKKLKPQDRETFYQLLSKWQVAGKIQIAHRFGTVAQIQQYNILGATQCILGDALKELLHRNHWQSLDPSNPFSPNAPSFIVPVLLDGPAMPLLGQPHFPIIGGDGKSLVIAMASIWAKVQRDHHMNTIDSQYPNYGFAQHKGYGTKKHRQALQTHGACPEHRPQFLRKILSTNGKA